LIIMSETAEGRKLLDRLYDELSSGYASEEELEQANRILSAKAQRIDPQKFIEADEKAMIIPFSTSGFTKFSTASLTVRRQPNGKLWVRSHLKAEHFADAKRLPNNDIWITGTEIDPDTVVGLYLYDEGGKIIYVPALYLLQLSNAEDTKILSMAGEAVFTGATLGIGSEAVVVAEGANATRASIWAARGLSVLKWTDRAAMVLFAAGTLINDHRGWIIETFGDSGRQFLKDWGKVERVLAIYGMARGALAIGQLGFALRTSFQNWRTAAKQMQTLTAEEKLIVDDIALNTEKTIKEIEDAQQAAASSGAKPQTGTAVAEAEATADNVVDLDKFRQQKAAAQKARRPVQQQQKTGTDNRPRAVLEEDEVVGPVAGDTEIIPDNAQGTTPGTSSGGGSAKPTLTVVRETITAENLAKVTVPSVRNDQFQQWFNSLSKAEMDLLWTNKELRTAVEQRLRYPGGYHEWLPVSRAPKFREWGITSEQIWEWRTLTKELHFVNPPGRHGMSGSGTVHLEIFELIDKSTNFSQYKSLLQEWAKTRLPNGIASLPPGLR
jgi:hypothetical protein